MTPDRLSRLKTLFCPCEKRCASFMARIELQEYGGAVVALECLQCSRLIDLEGPAELTIGRLQEKAA